MEFAVKAFMLTDADLTSPEQSIGLGWSRLCGKWSHLIKFGWLWNELWKRRQKSWAAGRGDGVEFRARGGARGQDMSSERALLLLAW